ncbi:hypothetical protein DC74_5371 [Streptomyces noursei]|nr:hypothetical protein DC74_5371 [Streptomyces noursei]
MAHQSVGVAAAVHPLVVVQDRGPRLAQEPDAADDLVPVLGVQLDDPALLRGQRPVLAQHPGGDAEFAHVVQDAGEPQHLQPVLGHAQFPGDQHRRPADPLAVPAGVAVLDVDGLDQGPDGGLVGGALPLVLRERPAGQVHRQQHQQRRGRPVDAVPEHRHHQPGQPVDEVGHRQPRRRAAPRGAQRVPLGEGQHAAAERGEHTAEGGRGGQRGRQQLREGRHRGRGRCGGADSPEDLGRRPGGQGEFGGVPEAAGGRPGAGGRREQGAGHGDQRRQRRWQQEGSGEHHGGGPARRKRSGRCVGPGRVPRRALGQRAAADAFAQAVQDAQGQGVGPGGGGAEPYRGAAQSAAARAAQPMYTRAAAGSSRIAPSSPCPTHPAVTADGRAPRGPARIEGRWRPRGRIDGSEGADRPAPHPQG